MPDFAMSLPVRLRDGRGCAGRTYNEHSNIFLKRNVQIYDELSD